MLQYLTYVLSPIFHLYHGLIFLITHPIQIIIHKTFGEKARLRTIRVLNFFLTKGFYIVGAKITITGKENLPDNNRPIIVIANHQSFYDIPIIGHLFKKNDIKFVAKASLGKGIPTISYNLRNGHSALVDRDNGGQAVREIFKLGRHIEETNYGACLYPEGTRSKTGKIQPFQTAGINTLLRSAPNALIIPFAIKGHAELIQKSPIWVRIGQHINYSILPAINATAFNIDDLTKTLHDKIAECIEKTN